MEQKHKNSKPGDDKPHHEHPLPGEIPSEQKKLNEGALQQAQEDISNDADLSIHNKNDDLDESETAKLGEENTGLI